jgi:hypothetical protein
MRVSVATGMRFGRQDKTPCRRLGVCGWINWRFVPRAEYPLPYVLGKTSAKSTIRAPSAHLATPTAIACLELPLCDNHSL